MTTAESRWLLWPPVIFFIIALGAPLIALVIQSFSDGSNGFAGIFTLSVFAGSVVRTLVLAAVVTVVSMVLGVAYAFAISLAPFWLRLVLLTGLVLSLWTSSLVRSFGWMLLELPKGAIYWFLNLVGLSDQPISLYQTALGMYPAMISIMLPFAALPLVSAIASIDRELLNAATVYGARSWLTLRTVVLPQIGPAMISGGVLVFVMSLGFYVTPVLLGGPSNLTLSGLINLQLGTANRPDLAAAISILLTGGTLLIYLIADRLFRVSEKWG
jgi:putative spermidine/putrescine transport system permease protein